MQLTPVELPSQGDDRRKGPGGPGRRPGGPGRDADKAKKAAPGKGRGGREQFTKQTLLEREERQFDPFHKTRRKGKERDLPGQTELTTPKAIKRIIKISETITIGDLAKRMGIKATDLIKAMMRMGTMVTINHVLDFDTAAILSSDYGYEVENVAVDLDEILEFTPDAPELLQERPPVVTIMGHVDHGKTSLLDSIRQANVISGEAGGITQHIGAYDVELHGRKITFLDTPGHEAFTAMRARGAQATDIAVLVVAADDGVMPQTVEAINHAKAAGVPIIVAINKMDKPTANPDRIMQDLTAYGLVAEDWGGDTIMVPVSALTGQGVDQLLEMITLQAEVLQLRANPNRNAQGIIIEAKLDKSRGPLATVLLKNGTLRVGDNIIAGSASGRVRALSNDRGERVESAGPSTPVEISGFTEVPSAGDDLLVVDDDRLSRQVAEERRDKERAQRVSAGGKVTLDNIFESISEGKAETLNLIVKADVQGSVEAVRQALEKLSGDQVKVRVLHAGVGAITKDDVNLASAFGAIIIGFNIRPDNNARDLAAREGIDVRLYRVIYQAIEDIEKAMKGMLEPETKETLLGHAEIRSVFKITGAGTIAGCYVLDGKVQRNASVRLLRDSVVVFEGKLSSLRRFKDDVREVAAGYECGIGLEGYNDIKEKDVIECYVVEEVEAAGDARA